MSKPTVTPLPVLLVLLDYWPLRRPLTRKLVVEKIPFFLLAIVFGVITIVSTADSGDVRLTSRPGTLLRTTYLLGFYLQKIAWPTNLSSIYTLPTPLTLANVTVIRAILVVLICAAAALIALRHTRAWAMAGVWFLLGVLPTVGLIHFSWISASDKYLYFPAIGLLIALHALVCAAMNDARRRWLAGAAALFLTIGIVLAFRECRRYLWAWRDTVALCEHMLTVSPDSPTLRAFAGDAYYRVGRYADAQIQLEQAIQIEPENAAARITLGVLLAEQGRLDEAYAHLSEGQMRGTAASFSRAHLMMGRVRVYQARPHDAIPHFEASVEAQPLHVEPRVELGMALANTNQLNRAAAVFEQVLRLDARSQDALLSLSMIANQEQRYADAARYAQALLEVDPANARGLFQLGLACQLEGNIGEAVKHYRRSVDLNPASAARNNLAWMLATSADSRWRDGREAVTLAEALPRDNVATLDTLAAAYAEAGRFDEAVKTARRALELAERGGQAELVAQLRQRLALYERGEPYRDPAPATRPSGAS